MSRLLFAAARGARIEYKLWDKWNACVWNPSYESSKDPDKFRVHPDDEHMQYGPISSALSLAAQDTKDDDMDGCFPRNDNFIVQGWYEDWTAYNLVGKRHRSLFLLILAEALADEGL